MMMIDALARRGALVPLPRLGDLQYTQSTHTEGR
jgi:hypothetical protein